MTKVIIARIRFFSIQIFDSGLDTINLQRL